MVERTERSIHRAALWHDQQADRKAKRGFARDVARHRAIAQALRDELRFHGTDPMLLTTIICCRPRSAFA